MNASYYANIGASALVAAILVWVYDVELVHFWGYTGFEGGATAGAYVSAVSVAALLASFIPNHAEVRSYLLMMLHYFFLIPTVVLIACGTVTREYVACFALVVLALFAFSSIKIRPMGLGGVDCRRAVHWLAGLIGLALAAYVPFGALALFNLDLEAVYEFRGEAADRLPAVFGYVYSNVASAMIPLCLCLALAQRMNMFVALSLVASTVLFGMTHHKSVFFTYFFVLALYLLFNRSATPYRIALLPLAVVVVAGAEVALNIALHGADERDVAMFSSYFVRRTLLVPPLLDSVYVDFFSDHPKYLWANSRLSFGLVTPPSILTPPFLIGTEVFGDATLAANTGIIGAGYANAGIFGVVLYAVLTGLLIALLDGFGARLGHGLVAAVAAPTILTITTTADLSTVILSHGLLLLLVLLASLQPQIEEPASLRRVVI